MLIRRPAALAALLVLPLALPAQPRARRPDPAQTPSARGPIGASPTELLNRRRQLELTPRQVARLDSLERTMVTRQRAFVDQARALRDSACGRQSRCNLSDSARRTLRDRLGALRNRQMDTTLGRQALAVLDSTQRGRVQGMRMGRAGQWMAMQRGAMRRGGFAGPGRGPNRGPTRAWQNNGRGRGGMNAGPGRRGPAAGRWLDAPRRGGPMGPQWDDRDAVRRPRRPMPPMGRRGDQEPPAADTTR